MSEQKVIFKIKNNDDGTQSVGLEFDPPIAGEDSEEKSEMNEEQVQLQNAAAHVASAVFEVLESES